MLQFHPNFDIRALKGFVTPKVVEAITEVEAEVATTRGVTLEAICTSNGRVGAKVEVPTKS